MSKQQSDQSCFKNVACLLAFFQVVEQKEVTIYLELLTSCWNNEPFPKQFEPADVITIYKKK